MTLLNSSHPATEAHVSADTPVPTASVCKVSQTDSETLTAPPLQDKQEAVEQPGPLFNLVRHLYFPDVEPHKEPGRQCPEFLVELPPELQGPPRGSGSLCCVMKGPPPPFVLWLYNRSNIKDSVSYSVKRDGPLSHLSAIAGGPRNGGPGGPGGHGDSYIYISSAGDAECSTVTKGWHLHVWFLCSLHSSH